jgi:pimeloyl-ACP methyl ester carboxylesterase/formiminotetrahydrofolate cyclodeaminase
LNFEAGEEWRLEQRAHLSRGAIAFDRFGEGLPVVLVHGTPTWSYLWRHVAPRLAQAFSVYVYDLHGYGDSPAPADADVSVAAQGDLLAELLDFWDLDEPMVAGHDIGGAAVLRAHLLHERSFRRIALIDAVALRPWITPTTRHVQAHLSAYQTMPEHIFEEIVATHLRTAVHGTFDDDAFEAYMNRWRGTRGKAAYLQKVALFDETHTAEFEPLLATLRTPVHLVWGGEDAWLEPGRAERLRELLPNSTLSLIPDAGHFAMEDAPEEVADILLEFFQDGAAHEPLTVSLEAAAPRAPDYLCETLGGFLDQLASREPAPGGGAAAAAAVAMAAGLAGMAAGFSRSPDLREHVVLADSLRRRVAALAQADADAYLRVLAAYDLPREQDPEVRRAAVQSALSAACDVPLAIAEVAEEVGRITAELAVRGNVNLRGDAIAGGFLAEAGARAAALLVQINLSDASDARGKRADRLARQTKESLQRAIAPVVP